LQIDEFAPRLSYFFNAHNDFFEEIAKYRAARRIWAREMRERFGARDPRSWLLRFHTQTAGCSLTAQQPENNVVRVAVQALAAVLGGTQSLHTNSLDEAWALPSEKAVTIALRTQQIIAHESGVAHTIDPLAGSYYVEWLTKKMEDDCYAYFRRIEEIGVVVAGIKAGFFQREIADSAFRYQKEIEEQDRVIVGVNDYVMPEKLEIPLLRVNEESERQHLERLHRVRRERDNVRVGETLAALEQAASGTANTMPFILDAVRAYATLGEICDVFRKVFGVYRDLTAF
jgi:methylmalonyl-CoA mutase N-terminal domain/subunit